MSDLMNRLPKILKKSSFSKTIKWQSDSHKILAALLLSKANPIYPKD